MAVAQPPIDYCYHTRHHEQPKPDAGVEPRLNREVHPENPGDEGNRQEDRSDDRQPLHHSIHLVGNLREMSVQHVPHQVAVTIQRFVDAEEVVRDISKVRQSGLLNVWEVAGG